MTFPMLQAVDYDHQCIQIRKKDATSCKRFTRRGIHCLPFHKVLAICTQLAHCRARHVDAGSHCSAGLEPCL